MDGVIAVDKPSGMTSHDVVDSVRRALATKKVGHAGTLDPDATGALIVGVGRATRFLEYAQQAPKRYRAWIRFGVTTTTEDAAGEVLERRAVALDEGVIRSVLATFVGDIEQVPPMVSAVKVGGERLYARARRGEEVERAPRSVSIYALELLDYEPREALATVDVGCSAGTYIRSLAADVGARVGCGAHLARLRRTVAGGFTESDLVALNEVRADKLRPLLDAVRSLPCLEVDESTALLVRHGRSIAVKDPSADEAGRPVALVHDGALLGVYARRGDVLSPERVVPQ
jgi:tRNA pseudouridine55 synthase